MFKGSTVPKGDLGLQVIRHSKDSGSIKSLLYDSNPLVRNLHPLAKEWRIKNYRKNIAQIGKLFVIKSAIKAIHAPIMTAYGALYLNVIKANGDQIYMGLAGTKVVTDVGVDYIVDAFQDAQELELIKFNVIVLGVSAEE